jgi:hypothetical protein
MIARSAAAAHASARHAADTVRHVGGAFSNDKA